MTRKVSRLRGLGTSRISQHELTRTNLTQRQDSATKNESYQKKNDTEVPESGTSRNGLLLKIDPNKCILGALWPWIPSRPPSRAPQEGATPGQSETLGQHHGLLVVESAESSPIPNSQISVGGS